jgi:hypothetical protein
MPVVLSDGGLLPRAIRNQLFRSLEDVGLEPLDFELGQGQSRSGNTVPMISHPQTSSYFKFGRVTSVPIRALTRLFMAAAPLLPISETRLRGLYRSESRVGEDGPVDFASYASSNDQVNGAVLWARAVKQQLLEPDLWELALRREPFEELRTEENTPFSPGELQAINAHLDEIQQWLLTQQHLADDRHAYIASQVDYLRASATTMGRKDWLMTAVGVFYSVAVGAAFAPQQAKALMQFADALLQQFSSGQRLLP